MRIPSFAARGLTTRNILAYCPTITLIEEDEVQPFHSILKFTVRPNVRINRTKKYLEKFVYWNKIVGFIVEVEVMHEREVSR